MWTPPARILVFTIGGLLLAAIALHLALRAAASDGRLARTIARAPTVDVLLFVFTAVPTLIGAACAGWAGVGAAILGQVIALLLWIAGHELANRKVGEDGSRPRIYRTMSRTVGPWRNHVALWWTALAVPAFWVVRAGQIVIYGPLTWTIRLPRYKHGDWINLSRQKFDGLVGYDLIWCLYCDWMTGVWSLASEMLRNVESFWCPIRFADPAKCANCRVDFPDLDNGWIPADGTMADVTALLESKYAEGRQGVNAWFGHPVRLTVSAGELGRTATGDR